MDDVEDDSHLRRGMPGLVSVPHLALLSTARLTISFVLDASCTQDLRSSSNDQFGKLCLLSRFPGTTTHPTESRRDQNRRDGHSYAFLLSTFLFTWTGKTTDERKREIEELLNLHRGQGMDLFYRENLVVPTEQEYIEMVNNSGFLPPHSHSVSGAELTNTSMLSRNWWIVPDSDQADDGRFSSEPSKVSLSLRAGTAIR